MKDKKTALNKLIKALSLCFITTFVAGAFAVTSFAASCSDLSGCEIDFNNISSTVATVEDEHEHVFTNYVSNNDATCDQDGTKTAKCDLCDETDTITDEGTGGHRFSVYISDQNSTCQSKGTQTAKCDRCDATDTKEGNETGSHSYKMLKCTGCGDVLLSILVPIVIGVVVAIFLLFFMRFDFIFRPF